MNSLIIQNTDDSSVRRSNESFLYRLETTMPITLQSPGWHLWGMEWDSTCPDLSRLDAWRTVPPESATSSQIEYANALLAGWTRQYRTHYRVQTLNSPAFIIVDEDVVANPFDSGCVLFESLGPSEASLQINWNASVHAFPTHTHDPLDIVRQLAEMKALKDGWANGMQPAYQWGEGYGKAPDSHGLDWLAEKFAVNYAADLPRPYLYPTPGGGVQAEWSLGTYEVSLEIDLIAHSAEWHCLDVQTDQSDELNLNLEQEDAWMHVSTRLRQLGSMAE